MTLPDPSPSSPTRPPVDHYYFTIRDPDNNITKLFTHGFGAHYAASRWIKTILDIPDTAQNWLSPNVLILTHMNGYTLTIRGSHLEDHVEQELTKKELLWTIPDTKTINTLINFHRSLISQPKEPEEQTKTTSNPKPPKRHHTQKPAPQGQITVAQLCEEINLAPNKGRNILRKAKIEKPPHGWTYKKDDPVLKTIRKLLAKG